MHLRTMHRERRSQDIPMEGSSSPSDTCPGPEWATPNCAKSVVRECIAKQKERAQQCRIEENTPEQKEENGKGGNKRRIREQQRGKQQQRKARRRRPREANVDPVLDGIRKKKRG